MVFQMQADYLQGMEWFGPSWKDYIVTFPNGSRWQLRQKISDHFQIFDSEPSEARAVFLASPCDAAEYNEAIIKIRMQIPTVIPGVQGLDSDPDVRAHEALSELSEWAGCELRALRQLTDQRCSSSPTLLSYLQTVQSNKMWVPGGYLIFFLIEKAPGVTVESILLRQEGLPADEIVALREVFKRDLMKLFACGIIHWDCRPDNVLYDQENGKCYFIDFEDAQFLEEGKRDPQKYWGPREDESEIWYRRWSLIALRDMAKPDDWWGGNR